MNFENQNLIENLNFSILSHLRASKNPWKRVFLNLSDFEMRYLEREFGINGRFKESYEMVQKLQIKNIRFFPNNTSIKIKTNHFFMKITRKKSLKYYENEQLSLASIKEKNNRVSLKFLVEREIN